LINEQFHNDRAAFHQALIDEQITLEDWKEQTRDRLIISILRRQQVTDKVTVPPGPVRALYEARRDKLIVPAGVHLHAIVINQGKTDADRESKHQVAVVVRGKLIAGADFADTAKEFSEGSKATDGGDWGWLEPSSLRAELKDAVDKDETGGISDIIEAGDAYYILWVEKRRDAGVVPFEQVRAELENELKQAEADRLYNEWMLRLRRKHYVQIF
jgi:peptidyl-prolyl cis-trans isomerase SurA